MPDPTDLPPVPTTPAVLPPAPMRPRVPLSVATAIGGALGLAAGVPTGAVVAQATDGPLPLRTFEWVLDHGVQGVLIVVVFVLGWFAWRSMRATATTEREWRASERTWMQERIVLEREYRVKVEALVREQVPIAERTRRALEQNTVVLRSLHLLDEDDEIDEGGA